MKINGLSLFSGIGGLDLALSEWVSPVAYCEINPYCQKVLTERMKRKEIDEAIIYEDVKKLSGKDLPSGIDIIFAGFPCQDISIAGNGKGLEGERSGLFFEITRLCSEIRPPFVFLENVPAIVYRGGERVCGEFAQMGYDCRWCTISAKEMGAPHTRERWFMLAHSNGKSGSGLSMREEERFSKSRKCFKSIKWDKWPQNESSLLRMDDGIPFRVDRTRSLGNSVVPSQAKRAFEILKGDDQ